MHPILRGGITLGLAVAAWTCVMGYSGWYKHPSLLRLFWLVIPIQIAVLIWTLASTRTQQRYLRQVGLGLAVSILGAGIIFLNSLLFTTILFPHYFQELETLGRALMAQQGLRPDQIEAAVKASAPTQTPLFQAAAGAFGTVATGVLVSVLAAIGLRRR